MTGTDRQVFFNQLVAQIANAQEFASRAEQGSELPSLDKYLVFADGSSLPIAGQVHLC